MKLTTFFVFVLMVSQYALGSEDSMKMKYNIIKDTYTVTSKVLVDGESVDYLTVNNVFPSSELIRYSEFIDNDGNAKCTVYFRQLEAYNGYWTMAQSCDDAVARNWVVFRVPAIIAFSFGLLLWLYGFVKD